ncbi:MAG: flagellar assembly protein FliW [Verrucomicrobiia bacterium]
MNIDTTIEPQNKSAEQAVIITLPLGLLGFEQTKRYMLIADPDEAPFMWLQMIDEPRKSFVVIQPNTFLERYEPELSEEDVRFLGLNKPEDAVVLNIVTVRGEQSATVNLKGPIVINRNTLIGKQVVPINAMDYSVQHPLL